MKLYEFAPTRSIRPRWTLQELAVPFEAITVNLGKGEHLQSAYRELNPACKLPTLVDGDFVVTESVAIVQYLAEKYADKGLLPSGLRERTELQRWLLFTVTELEQPLWRIARNKSVYPPEQRVAADIPSARHDFETMVKVIEAHMKHRNYVVGDKFTTGDIVLAYTLDWANEENLLSQTPQLRVYMERMYQRPHAPMRIAKALESIR